MRKKIGSSCRISDIIQVTYFRRYSTFRDETATQKEVILVRIASCFLIPVFPNVRDLRCTKLSPEPQIFSS